MVRISEKFKKRAGRLAAVLTAAAMTAGLCACSQETGGKGAAAEDEKGTKVQTESAPMNEPQVLAGTELLSVCVGASPNTMDPSLNVAMDVGTILTHLFEGLYAISESGEPEPAQASACEVSEDGLTYTFTLRDNLVWSDGTPLTAEDYVYSWRRLADPLTGNSSAYMLQAVAGYEEAAKTGDMSLLEISAPDSETFVVKLNVPTSYFLNLIAAPYFYPVQQKALAENGESWAVSAETYVCNGPYVMKEWVQDSFMLLEKNPLYRDPDAAVSDEIKFVFFGDHGSELTAFETGEIQFADDVPVEELARLRDEGKLHSIPLMGTYYLSLNAEKEPFDNPLVRKALTLSLDRDWLCQYIGQSGETPAGAFVPPIIRGANPGERFRDAGEYFDAGASANEANLEEAKKALAQAGYPNGEGLPALELLYVEGSLYKSMAEAIQSQWAELGIRADLVQQEWGTFLSSVQGKNYQVASLSWMGDYDDPFAFLSLFTADSSNNFTGWSNETYDSLIKAVSTEMMDEKTRFEKMRQAEDILFDEWALCPLYYFVDAYLADPELEGVRTTVYGTKSFISAGFKVPEK